MEINSFFNNCSQIITKFFNQPINIEKQSNADQKAREIAQQNFQEQTSNLKSVFPVIPLSENRVLKEKKQTSAHITFKVVAGASNETSPSLSISSKSEFSNVSLGDTVSLDSFNMLYKKIPDYAFSAKLGEHTYHLQGMGLGDQGEWRGVGNFSRVFLGVDENGKEVAVKVAIDTRNDMGHLQKEAEFLLEMRGKEHVLGAQECGFLGNKLFIVMEPMKSGELSDHIVDDRLSFKQKIELLLDSVLGIKECHDAGILHRDIKPGNIMIEKIMQQDGSELYKARVIDLGLAAKIIENPKDLAGTFDYMAPEIILTRDQTPACDVFSFGQVIYNTLSGMEASQTFPIRIHRNHPLRNPWREPWGNIEIPQQTLVDAGVPDPLASECRLLIEDCLKWFPQERPSIQEVILRLGNILQQIP